MSEVGYSRSKGNDQQLPAYSCMTALQLNAALHCVVRLTQSMDNSLSMMGSLNKAVNFAKLSIYCNNSCSLAEAQVSQTVNAVAKAQAQAQTVTCRVAELFALSHERISSAAYTKSLYPSTRISMHCNTSLIISLSSMPHGITIHCLNQP